MASLNIKVHLALAFIYYFLTVELERHHPSSAAGIYVISKMMLLITIAKKIALIPLFSPLHHVVYKPQFGLFVPFVCILGSCTSITDRILYYRIAIDDSIFPV